MKKIRNQWSKGRIEPDDEVEAKSLFKKQCNKRIFATKYMIDEQTWSDLDMDNVFRMLDHTISGVGSQVLYSLLRFPEMRVEELKKREGGIQLFSKNSTLRESIQLGMLDLDKRDSHQLTELLWGELPEKPVYFSILYILNLISVLVIPIVIANLLPWYFLLMVYAVNIGFYYHFYFKISVWLTAISLIPSLEKAAICICNNSVSEIEEECNLITNHLPHLTRLSKKLWLTSLSDKIGWLDYLKIYFLVDIICFYKGLDELKNHRGSIQSIFLTVGTIDSLIAVASYRSSKENWVQPDFNDENEIGFSFKELTHPLLDKPTANTFLFNTNSLIVTGSNMAGKSTFIKTLGINSILAQTIYTCHAKEWNFPLVVVRSCMNIRDDLQSGKSYYLAEAERIYSMVMESDNQKKHLFLIDEIFKGTNYRERLAAAIEVSNYISNSKDLVVIATHDIELCKSVKGDYKFIHFTGEIIEGNLYFDYKIKPGLSSSTNAIDILKLAGFPDRIISNALNRF